jgi:hypothetical protein
MKTLRERHMGHRRLRTLVTVILLLALGNQPAPGHSSTVPAVNGTVMVITVHVSRAGDRSPLFRIDGLKVMRGNLPGHRSWAGAAGVQPSTAAPETPAADSEAEAPAELLLRDRSGGILYRERFSYPDVITIPPVPPGEQDDGLPGILPLDEQDVALVVPYVAAADRVEVRDTRGIDPAFVRVLSDQDRLLPDGRIARETVGVAAVQDALSLLIIASGYLPAQMPAFQARAAVVREAVLGMQPFAAQRASVRVALIENTADLGCAPGCSGIDRLMCCNTSRVLAAAAGSGAPYDEIVVIHNIATYSGFGYRDAGGYKSNSFTTYCGVYDGPSSAPLAVHEFGHSFGNLCDEYALEPTYSYSACVNCRSRCEELQNASACLTGCDAKPSYFRPEPSIMLSLLYASYNQTSIESTLAPDGLRTRLNYFTGAVAGTGTKGQFPPRDQVLAFRETLETYYRDSLRRAAGPSFVDVEGEAVWIPEYLRYRLTQCTHEGAVQRVLAQIAGYGVPSGCGGVSADYAFPPRDQTLSFRVELERLYRDDLHRSAGATSVDIEGNAVWLQEYLRYRLHACSHYQASTKVLMQIEGQGIQPVCW